MMYPFMTLDNNTEVVHSELLQNGTVKVYIEKPDEKDCFHSVSCYLPEYEWNDVNGFNNDEIKKYQDYLETVARLIIQLAQQM